VPETPASPGSRANRALQIGSASLAGVGWGDPQTLLLRPSCSPRSARTTDENSLFGSFRVICPT
jgi:hypothetical protein